VGDLSSLEAAARLLLAAALCGGLGLERELRDSPAGLRTHVLVGVGAALFTMVGAYAVPTELVPGAAPRDPFRVAAQIVSGIGFVGAGAVIQSRGSVRGLTTAASLWMAAAVGFGAGAGAYAVTIAAAALGLLMLWPMREAQTRLLRSKPPTLAVVTGKDVPLDEVLGLLDRYKPIVISVRTQDDRRIIEVRMASGAAADEMLRGLAAHEEIESVERR
jgi:putative Mg2+ transporter-C (MgtC) family protein